jgi:hypothetical protein
MRDRMNSVRIGMTHQEVERLVGKPTFVTTTGTNSGRTEICNYGFDTLNSANSLRSFIMGVDNIEGDISMVVVYNDGRVLSVQRSYDSGPAKNVFESSSLSYGANEISPNVQHNDGIQMRMDNNRTAGNTTPVHNNVKESAGVHVNSNMTVTNVVLNSPAYNAGLKSGDIILAFGGISVNDTASLKKLTDAVTFGDRKIVRVRRGDNILDLTICYPQLEGDK